MKILSQSITLPIQGYLFIIFILTTTGIATAQTIPLCKDKAGDVVLYQNFGSGELQYSDASPATLGFSTTYFQKFGENVNDSMFSFENKLANDFGVWHSGESDHTAGDEGGYMMVVNADYIPGEFYRDTVTDLCAGSYKFSAFVGNIFLPDGITQNSVRPDVKFEVRDTENGVLIATSNSGPIEPEAQFTWQEYGVSFTPLSRSVVLLMISNGRGGIGNDLAIDDITLTVQDGPTGLNAARPVVSSFTMYPNPSIEEVFIESKDHSSFQRVTIRNSMGLEILDQASGGQAYTFWVGNFEKGVYSVTVRSGKGTETQKLVVY